MKQQGGRLKSHVGRRAQEPSRDVAARRAGRITCAGRRAEEPSRDVAARRAGRITYAGRRAPSWFAVEHPYEIDSRNAARAPGPSAGPQDELFLGSLTET